MYDNPRNCCTAQMHFVRAQLPPSRLTAPRSSALASALNKTGAFAKNAPLPVNPGPHVNINSGAGAAADLLTMTSRLKELMDPSNPNCLPPPPVDGYGGAPVPSDDDMLNVAQVKGHVKGHVSVVCVTGGSFVRADAVCARASKQRW